MQSNIRSHDELWIQHWRLHYPVPNGHQDQEGLFPGTISVQEHLRRVSLSPFQIESLSVFLISHGHRLRNFSIAAQDVDVAVAGCELSAQQEAQLQRIGVSCKGLLSDLEKETGKYKNLQPGSNASNRSARRLWDRLRWEPDDIRDIRLRIISMTSLLNTVLGGLAR